MSSKLNPPKYDIPDTVLKKVNYFEAQTLNPNIHPWHSIGILLVSNGTATNSGSGFMIEPDIFLTAKHNFTKVKGYNTAAIWLGYDKNNPSKRYSIYPPKFHNTLDLAIVLLDDCSAQPFNFYTSDLPLLGCVCGYGKGKLTLSEGMLLAAKDSMVRYSINTEEGDSGAPVLIKHSDNNYSVIALHTNAAPPSVNENEGVLFKSELIDEIKESAYNLRKQHLNR